MTMKTKLLACLLALCPMMGHAAVIYRVEQVTMPDDPATATRRNDMFARDHRFYIGAMYDFSMWNDDTSDIMHVTGKDTSGFDVMAGIRMNDIIRLEANYIHTDAKWDAFSLRGDGAMVNILVDARINGLYRLMRSQRLVPYVGAGAGMSWNTAHDTETKHTATPMAAAMVGLGIELGENFTLDFGYKYLYMFKPKFEFMPDMAPTAHQLRAGVRINF